jgi:GAF domain-containing protein
VLSRIKCNEYRNYIFLNTFAKTFRVMIFEALKPQVSQIVSNTEKTVNERLLNICELLETHIEYYNWVGFYFRNGDKEELLLGPYVGAPTDHTVIPFGKGICGQVAVSNKNFVVPDVSAQDNYIACSITVKSEIVIPIFVDGKNIGQIDIDSNTPDPFTEADERFLEYVCEKVSELLSKSPK